MRQVARLTAVLGACSVLGIGLAATAQAVPRDHKVTFCHGTASDTNPYVLITVDEHALGAHFNGTDPGTGHGGQNMPDVFPDANGSCPVPVPPS